MTADQAAQAGGTLARMYPEGGPVARERSIQLRQLIEQ